MKKLILLLLMIITSLADASDQNNIFDLNQYKWHILISVALIFILKVVIFLLYRRHILHKMKMEVESLRAELAEKNNELEELSTRDSLTGLINRRTINQKIEEELIRNKRYETPFSILLIDIDYFKNINEKFGSSVGDFVLQQIAKLINKNTRAIDISARWGGKEFLILANNTDLTNAIELAEKLRGIISKFEFENIGYVTVSIGVSEYNKGEKFETLNNRTEEALKDAKENGRNQVIAKDFPRDINEEINELRLKWSKNYMSNNELIDSQHMELYNLTNKLIDLILSKSEYHEIEKKLDEIKSKTKEHFKNEEEILLKYKYENYDKHKKSHFNLLFELERHLIKYKLGEFSNVELLKFISHRLILDHFMKEDQDYFGVLGKELVNES